MAVIAKRLVVRLATAAKRQSYVFDDDGTIGRPELNAPTCIQGAVRHGYNRYLLVRHLRCAAIAPRIVQRSARAFRDYRGDCVRAGGGRQDPRPARGVEYHMQAAHAFCRVDTTAPVVTYIDLVIGIVTNRVVHSSLLSEAPLGRAGPAEPRCAGFGTGSVMSSREDICHAAADCCAVMNSKRSALIWSLFVEHMPC